MKNLFYAFAGMVLVFGSFSLAEAQVKLGAESKTEIKGVRLSETAQMREASPVLPRVTDGLRQKKVVFAWFSVYVAQVFSASAKPDFTSVAALEQSLQKGFPVIISMTFLRDVGMDKISDGFMEGFKENKMDATTGNYADFLTALKRNGDVKDQQKFFFVFSGDADKKSLSVQTQGKEFYSLKDQNSATIDPFLNLWFGKPADSGLEQLQTQFLKNGASAH